MAKNKMSKMVLLPLFLGCVTLASAGVLTGVHLLTAPAIENNKEQKKLEGYKVILDLDSSVSIELVEAELQTSLSSKGVSKKNNVNVDGELIGVVYDATITGWEAGLTFQVGFKDDIYAGFNLISSNETPGMGKDYLDLVNERIKGVKAADPVLIDDDGSYTGVTAPITGSALKSVLELCAADYLGAVEPEPEPTTVANLNAALNITTGDDFGLVEVPTNLKEGGIILIYNVFSDGVHSGTVYEAIVKGFKDGLHFLVGFSGVNYAGFYVIESHETPDWGGDYLNQVNDWIKGQPAADPVLLNDGGLNVGVTKTYEALEKTLSLSAEHYLESAAAPTSIANLNSALNIITGETYTLVGLTQDLMAGGVVLKYEVSDSTAVVGVVYEVIVKGFKEGLHFLVGFSGVNYAGFLVIESHETPDWGGTYLPEVNDFIKNQPAADPVLLNDGGLGVGVTKTKDAVVIALELCATDYLEGVN